MKTGRHSRILDIIERHDIVTQEELARELKISGYDVTQATVSRDIKELRLIKIPDDHGVQKYAAVGKAERGVSNRMQKLFAGSVLSVTFANNIIVIKTVVGGANTVAVVVDAMRNTDILGCVAGDDTIIIIISSNEAVTKVMQEFNKMLA